jgi:hypothetical protein
MAVRADHRLWSAPVRRFGRHFLEMVAAMFVGMLALMPVSGWVFDWLGAADRLEDPVIAALVMATTMSIGMAAWMRYRRHGWLPTGEMVAAMYVSYAVFFVPYWAGALSGHGVLMAGHIVMIPAMLGVMLLRRDEYTGAPHRRHTRPGGSRGSRPASP